MDERTDMGEIKKIDQLTDTPFLNFFELHTVKKTGKPGRYYLASRAKNVEELEISRKQTHADGVVMYCICGENRDRVLLIRQFRWPIGAYVYEFPAGLVEDGEDYREAAVREVWEETGLNMQVLDVDPMFERPYYMTDGMTDEACATVYGYVPDELKKQHLEDSEEIEVVIADREEARRILKEERIAGNCAYHLMHFISEQDPFAYLRQS